MMTPEQRADEAIKRVCPTCHREAGRKCRTVGGRSFRPMARPHAARLALVPVDDPATEPPASSH